MRGIQPNLRASSSYVEPERMCGLHRRAGAARRILVLVTSRIRVELAACNRARERHLFARFLLHLFLLSN
jgi:hypothetical protein